VHVTLSRTRAKVSTRKEFLNRRRWRTYEPVRPAKLKWFRRPCAGRRRRRTASEKSARGHGSFCPPNAAASFRDELTLLGLPLLHTRRSTRTYVWFPLPLPFPCLVAFSCPGLLRSFCRRCTPCVWYTESPVLLRKIPGSLLLTCTSTSHGRPFRTGAKVHRSASIMHRLELERTKL
jgi:hypothetical protein